MTTVTFCRVLPWKIIFHKKQRNSFGIIKLNCIWELKKLTTILQWRHKYCLNLSKRNWYLLPILLAKYSIPATSNMILQWWHHHYPWDSFILHWCLWIFLESKFGGRSFYWRGLILFSQSHVILQWSAPNLLF